MSDDEPRGLYLDAEPGLLARCRGTTPNRESVPAVEPTLVPGAGRVLMGCVADNDAKYLSQALRLLQSVRWFGDRMAGVDFVVCLVGSPDRHYVEEFERLGASVQVVPPFSSVHPHSNKLRLLELPETSAYDTVMLLDCDTVIVQDPSPFLDGEAFQAKMADWPTIPHDVFQRLFRHFGLESPRPEYRCNPSGKPTVWYCNAGVLVFSQEVLATLGSAWRQLNLALLDRLDLLEPYSFYCEQASLSLAFASQPVPFRELPLSMNFPTHSERLLALPAMQVCDPVILHYHDGVDSNGCLKSVPCPGAQMRIEEFNRHLQQERRRGFDNRLFWDFRYAHDPELGSGLASRGTVKEYKRRLLRELLAALQPESILDVGCGDQAVSKEVPDDVYTGIDISSVAVERNRLAYPNRRFIRGDLLDLDVPPADVVICLDVLIHVDDAERYRAMVHRAVALTTRMGLISGYEAPPAHESSICFYHEPLTETLRRAGGHALRRVGAYRDVVVWVFQPPSGQVEPGIDQLVRRIQPLRVNEAYSRSKNRLISALAKSSPRRALRRWWRKWNEEWRPMAGN
jgi:SAM-dependent methyltransferase